MVYSLPHLFICKTKQVTFNLRSCLVSFKEIRHSALLLLSRSENPPGHSTCILCKHELVGKSTKKMDTTDLALTHHDLLLVLKGHNMRCKNVTTVLGKYPPFHAATGYLRNLGFCKLRCNTSVHFLKVWLCCTSPPLTQALDIMCRGVELSCHTQSTRTVCVLPDAPPAILHFNCATFCTHFTKVHAAIICL